MACLASMLFCPMKRLDNGISHAASASSCPAGEVYRSIGEQANAEPAETTQHACPSTGHEQQETACEGEWEQEPGSRGAKCRRWTASTAEDYQCHQREEEMQHVQEATHGCHQRHRTGESDEGQQDPVEQHGCPGYTCRGVNPGNHGGE